MARLDHHRQAFARSVIRGLEERPRWLSCRYLYDHAGSTIFERITEQPEYYPTRTEDGILRRDAARIRELCGASTLVELGAGSAAKTRHLLRAWSAIDRAAAVYVPIDISGSMLAQTCSALGREFPSLRVQSLAGSYEQALPALRRLSPQTLLFLGSSIGNLNAEELDDFFGLVTASLAGGDHFLLGIDLVKDVAQLEAAYNDAAGWSAAFTLNLFARMNRELGTDIDLESLEHVARWNPALSRIEIFARFLRPVTIRLSEWNREFVIEAGETVLVEISRKFECGAMIATAGRHGFRHMETFTDPDRWFALLLLRRVALASPASALRDRLRNELARQRARTLKLVAPLDAGQLTRQHCRILSPVVWDLGHIATYEREWTQRAVGRAAEHTTENSHAGDEIDGLYDPMLHPRPVRGSLPLPRPEACLEMLEATRAVTSALVAETAFDGDGLLLRNGYVFSMIAQHEAQHSETILQAIQLLPSLQYEPARILDSASPPAGAAAAGIDREAFIPAGPFVMGTVDTAVAYDNERPAHEVDLDSYWIDLFPVTNGVYRRFIEDGGYRQRDLWTAEGRRWLRRTNVRHPAGWKRLSDGSWAVYAFGRLRPLDESQPVVHVSWYEAAACARWLGKRLPTEAEWEKAAAWDLERGVPRLYPWGNSAPTAARANLDQRTFAPLPVGSLARGCSYFGCHQMIGDVWEWTASDFLPYPGFRAFPYEEYSQVHFGSRQKVLRGGSWATPSIAIRNTFRNWDLPQRRQIFAGFRCVRD